MPDFSTYSLAQICRRLGQRGGDHAQVTYLRGLVANYGFPPPYPTPIKGKGVTRDIRANSKWPCEPVDAWFYNFNPPASAAADELAAREAARIMDERAANLTLVGGTHA